MATVIAPQLIADLVIPKPSLEEGQRLSADIFARLLRSEDAKAASYADIEARVLQGADVSMVSPTDLRSNMQLIHYAATHGRADIVRLLIRAGANPNAIGGVTHSTPLIFAGNYGDTDTIDTLLAAGADATLQNDAGHSALHRCLVCGHLDNAVSLWQAGARLQDHFRLATAEAVMWSRNTNPDFDHKAYVRKIYAVSKMLSALEENEDTTLRLYRRSKRVWTADVMRQELTLQKPLPVQPKIRLRHGAR